MMNFFICQYLSFVLIIMISYYLRIQIEYMNIWINTIQMQNQNMQLHTLFTEHFIRPLSYPKKPKA